MALLVILLPATTMGQGVTGSNKAAASKKQPQQPAPAAVALPIAQAPSSTEVAPPPQPSESVKAVAVNSLLNERLRWQARSTSIAGPLTLTIAGVVLALVGAGIWGASDDEHFDEKKAGEQAALVATWVAAAGALTGGIIWWNTRTTEQEKATELQRIDSQLRAYGVQASMIPWFTPRTQFAGMSGGLQLTLRY